MVNQRGKISIAVAGKWCLCGSGNTHCYREVAYTLTKVCLDWLVQLKWRVGGCDHIRAWPTSVVCFIKSHWIQCGKPLCQWCQKCFKAYLNCLIWLDEFLIWEVYCWKPCCQSSILFYMLLNLMKVGILCSICAKNMGVYFVLIFIIDHRSEKCMYILQLKMYNF